MRSLAVELLRVDRAADRALLGDSAPRTRGAPVPEALNGQELTASDERMQRLMTVPRRGDDLRMRPAVASIWTCLRQPCFLVAARSDTLVTADGRAVGHSRPTSGRRVPRPRFAGEAAREYAGPPRSGRLSGLFLAVEFGRNRRRGSHLRAVGRRCGGPRRSRPGARSTVRETSGEALGARAGRGEQVGPRVSGLDRVSHHVGQRRLDHLARVVPVLAKEQCVG